MSMAYNQGDKSLKERLCLELREEELPAHPAYGSNHKTPEIVLAVLKYCESAAAPKGTA